MYKVIIVDDEPIIVEGLRKVVHWADYGCEVVATANGGQEGLEAVRTYRPDIVFSDISMPGMDGLSMIAALRSEFPDMYITILTGYRDFDYAQRAINLGVFRFLLKPSNMKEIQEAVENMVKKLDLSVPQESREIKTNGIKQGENETGEVCHTETREEKTSAEMPGGEEQDANSFVVNNAIRFMEANYQRKITLIDVADQVYVSQWHLSKLLNRYTGKNFSEILNGCRIEAAKKLLAEPKLRIADVAEQVGFMDTAHFSRVFKKLTGVSANEYRNAL